MITRLAGLLAAAMLLGACSLLPTASTVPEETPSTSIESSDPGEPSNGTDDNATSTNTDPVSGYIVVTDHAVTIAYDDAPAAVLTGDIDYPLASAFADLLGGLVFQYADPGPDISSGVLRLLPGTIEPLVLLEAVEGEHISLLEVTEIDGRPTVVYTVRPTGQLLGGQLVAADIQGGAPIILYDGPDLVSGSVDDNLIVIELRVNSACNKLVGFIDGDAVWEADCTNGSGPSGVAVAGGAVATIMNDSVSVSRVDGEQAPEFAITTADQIFDVGNDRAIATFDEFSLVVATTEDNTIITWDEPIRSASLFDTTLAFTEGHRLGGIQVAQGPCSAAGQSATAVVQPDLPGAVAATRSAITAQAVACDFDGLAALTSPSFTVSLGGGDARRTWMASEAQFGDDLSLIVRILNLPFTTTTLDDGRQLYVWPSAAGDDLTQVDWDDLTAVFNEEEIDVMRQTGSYSGHRVGIAADGEWLFSVAGD